MKRENGRAVGAVHPVVAVWVEEVVGQATAVVPFPAAACKAVSQQSRRTQPAAPARPHLLIPTHRIN